MTTIYVDADACPVKDEVERVATRLDIPVVMVCNGGIRPSRNPLISLRIVAEGPDVADQVDRRTLRAGRCGGHRGHSACGPGA